MCCREFMKMLGRSSFVGSRQPTLSSQLSEHPQSCGPRFEKAETRVRHPWFQDLMSGCESLLRSALQKRGCWTRLFGAHLSRFAFGGRTNVVACAFDTHFHVLGNHSFVESAGSSVVTHHQAPAARLNLHSWRSATTGSTRVARRAGT